MKNNMTEAFENAKRIIDEQFQSLLVDENSTVCKAAKYSLLSSGKMLRPTFVFETANMLNTKLDNNIVKLATAIELIHTYSLIHDDLPAMDNDDMRRGQPSCHKVFGDGMAILAGDALLNTAFEVLLSGAYTPNYYSAIAKIVDCSGVNGMIGGQSDDIDNNVIDTTDKLTKLVVNKTSKLFEAAIVSSAIYVGASKLQQQYLLDFAVNFGLAFQIKDDLFDIDANSQDSTGKPSGSDAKNSKSTFVGMLGANTAKQLLIDVTNKAKKSIDTFDNNAFFIQLCEYNLVRTK